MILYYRISNNSNSSKIKLPNATKEHCLDNFLKEFDKTENDITIVADNLFDYNLKQFIISKIKYNIHLIETKLGNSKSFIYCLENACSRMSDVDWFYMSEDDYLYLPNSFQILKEALEISDYVTLYDHIDKYMEPNEGGNPQIENGGELTKVVLTKSSHWKFTNSTTGTFGANADVLKKDISTWKKYFFNNECHDYEACCELTKIHGRSLISCIPGKSTHTETRWLSPLIDWTKI